MPFGSRHARPSRSHSQRGQALLALLMLLGIALTVFVYNVFDPFQASARREARTRDVLMEARDALIGYAASSATRPGQLPCPDTNNDGDAEPLVAGNCPSNIGRLPWRTLGLQDLRDSAGERLWYAPSPVFTRDGTSCVNVNNPLAPCPLNSDTLGTLTVSQDKAATVITNEAVAVIFAPGLVLAGQLRDPANENNPANYLDTTDGVSNASSPAFIRAQRSDTPAPGFNDKVMVMDTTHLITVVEKRVALTLLKMLTDYKTAFPGKYTGADKHMDNEEDDDVFRGWLPICQAEPSDWEDLVINVPAWLASNDWWKVIYYAVAPDKTVHCPGSPAGCGMLTVDSTPNFEVVLITPGPAPAGVTRLSVTTVTNSYAAPPPANNACIVLTVLTSAQALAYWQQYLDPNDTLNYDHNDNTYATPSSTAYARNRLYTCPGTPGIC